MKKLLTGIFAFTIILNAFSQQLNEEEKLFVKHLNKLGYVQQDNDEHLYDLLVELENDTLYEKHKGDKDYVRMKMNEKGIYNYNFELREFELNAINKSDVKEIADSNIKKMDNNGGNFKQAIKIQKAEDKYKGKMLVIPDGDIVIENYNTQIGLLLGGNTTTRVVIEGKTTLENIYFQALYGDSSLKEQPKLEQYKELKEKIHSTAPKEKLEIKNSIFRKSIPIRNPFNGFIITDLSGIVILSDVWTQ